MDQANLIKKYIHHRSLLVKGHSELSLAVSVFNYAMLMWLTLRDIITFPRIYVLLILPGTFVVVFIIQYIIGWIWERKKLVNEEQDWLAVRNPVLKEILREAKKKDG